VEGVPDVGDKPGDLADDGGLQGGGHGDVGGGEAVNGRPDPAEFLQCGLTMQAVTLVFSQLACEPVGGLFEQFVDAGTAVEVADVAAEEVADVTDRRLRITNGPLTSIPLASQSVCAFRGTGGYARPGHCFP
jgi:hypothetical protein